MKAKGIEAVKVMCVAVAVLFAVNANSIARAEGDPGHEVTSLKADGQLPYGDANVAFLNSDRSGVKKAIGATKSAVTDAKTATEGAKQTVSDGQQTASDAKRAGSDGKQLGADLKKKNLSQGVKDAKRAVNDVKKAGNDVATATGDAKQAIGGAAQVVKDLKGFGGLFHKSSDDAASNV